jgi:hypothetical protein
MHLSAAGPRAAGARGAGSAWRDGRRGGGAARAVERAAARAEAATQAPWRAAIVLAQGAKRAARETRRQTRNLRNNPPGAGAEAETHNPRNDPMRGVTLRARVAAGAPVDAPSEFPPARPVSDGVAWAPGSPGWGEALAREVMARRLRAALALRGNDPKRGPAAGAPDARKVPRLGSMRGLALGSTTLAPTWALSLAETLATRFGPPAPERWLGAPLAPKGIAAMPSGDYAQRPYTGPDTGPATLATLGNDRAIAALYRGSPAWGLLGPRAHHLTPRTAHERPAPAPWTPSTSSPT